MSKIIFSINKLLVTNFYGGKERGRCLQFTIGTEYAQLERRHMLRLRSTLKRWLNEEHPYKFLTNQREEEKP